MSLHKNIKNAKIIEELYTYLLEKGYKKFSSTIEILAEESVFIVDVPTEDMRLHDMFKKDLFCCRDVELEEYGWELMGESACVCELDTIGMLVDDYEISYENGICHIVLHRKEL